MCVCVNRTHTHTQNMQSLLHQLVVTTGGQELNEPKKSLSLVEDTSNEPLSRRTRSGGNPKSRLALYEKQGGIQKKKKASSSAEQSQKSILLNKGVRLVWGGLTFDDSFDVFVEDPAIRVKNAMSSFDTKELGAVNTLARMKVPVQEEEDVVDDVIPNATDMSVADDRNLVFGLYGLRSSDFVNHILVSAEERERKSRERVVVKMTTSFVKGVVVDGAQIDYLAPLSFLPKYVLNDIAGEKASLFSVIEALWARANELYTGWLFPIPILVVKDKGIPLCVWMFNPDFGHFNDDDDPYTNLRSKWRTRVFKLREIEETVVESPAPTKKKNQMKEQKKASTCVRFGAVLNADKLFPSLFATNKPSGTTTTTTSFNPVLPTSLSGWGRSGMYQEYDRDSITMNVDVALYAARASVSCAPAYCRSIEYTPAYSYAVVIEEYLKWMRICMRSQTFRLLNRKVE